MAKNATHDAQVEPQDDYAEVEAGEAGGVIDFGGVSDSNVFPVGEYVMTVAAAVPGVSKKGQPKMDVRFKIEEVPADGDSSLVGRTHFETFSFSPNALGITKQRLVALGMSPSFRGGLPEIAETILHATAVVVLGVETSTEIDATTNEPYPPKNRIKRIKRATAVADAL